MCVAITMDEGTELTLDEVVKMNRSNADGVGVAWVRNGTVQWYKTTRGDLRTIALMINHWKGVPRLVHFRFATVGGTRPDLCHPFEVGPMASCKPVDSSQLVMIHNGHWSRWKEVHDLLEKEDLLPDKGPWSDSRLAALMMHQNMDWVHALGGRVATMDHEGTITRWGSWDELRPGVFVSNKTWDTTGTYKRGGYTGYRQWKGWDWDDKDWAAFEEEQKALVKAQLMSESEPMAETCDPSVMYSYGNGQNVHIQGQDGANPQGQDETQKVQTAKKGTGEGFGRYPGSRNSRQPIETAGEKVAQRALPAPEGDPAVSEGGRNGGTPGEYQRRYSETPWVNPYTGACYQAREDGSLVRLTPRPTPVHVEPNVGGANGPTGGVSAEVAKYAERGYYHDGEGEHHGSANGYGGSGVDPGPGDGDYEDLTHLNPDDYPGC